MKCIDVFPKELKTKIRRTRLGRGGKGLYKRRNSRSYRVIIHYVTYLNILNNDPKILDNYKRGYVVRIKPSEYFENNGTIKKNFHKSLKLGENSILYFKDNKDWEKYGEFCKNFKEAVELYTQSTSIGNQDQWSGEYCTFITNSTPQKISLICSSGKKTQDQIIKFKDLKNKFGKDLPEQAGLGNFDIDYASNEEMENVCYQLSKLIFQVPEIKNELMARVNGLNLDKIKKTEKHINNYCDKNNLFDVNKLQNIRALNKKNRPICPLCLEELDAKKFFEKASQDEGREEEDNTQSEIVLMHIKALAPAEFNHCTYNLAWGHKHCNTIQGPSSIKDTLIDLKRILKNNNYC